VKCYLRTKRLVKNKYLWQNFLSKTRYPLVANQPMGLREQQGLDLNFLSRIIPK
jgi:hypothetical protein